MHNYRLPTVKELTTAGVAGLGATATLQPWTPLGHWKRLRRARQGLGATAALKPWTADSTRPGNTLRIVRQRLPDHYQKLMNYLASGSWKEADHETEQMMLKAVGTKAEQRGYLSPEEIRNFPCKDLLLIDGLWVKFSGGKFGFSVQKQIWVEVGGKLDFGEDEASAKAAYVRFGDSNGWRRENSFVNYRNLKFDLSAPAGHLPAFRNGGFLEEVDGSLISRLVNCSK